MDKDLQLGRIFYIFVLSLLGKPNKLQFAKLHIDQRKTTTNFHFSKTTHVTEI